MGSEVTKSASGFNHPTGLMARRNKEETLLSNPKVRKRCPPPAPWPDPVLHPTSDT